jgi:hypothetical protein
MKKYFALFVLIISVSLGLQAQQQSEFNKYPLHAKVNISAIESDYLFNVQLIEAPKPDGQPDYLQKVKAQIAKKTDNRTNEPAIRSAVEKPISLYGYNGNGWNGHVPNDNDLAISNEGKIVSVTNSVIYFYENDSMIHPPISLDTFASSFNLPHGKFDPKVLYDPNDDKFIIAFLNGFSISTSMLFLAFSETNDPTGNWHIYTLPGNPLSDSSWSDFPMISLSEDELFFTINLLRPKVGNETWKTTFKQTLIWQIDKAKGYAGDSLATRLYHDIDFEGTRIRNICPVHYGREPDGDDMYFLSDRNFSLSTDSFFLLHINGKMNEPTTNIKVELVQSDVNYGVAPSADQPVNRLLETNDARVLDAFIQNDQIYFCGNSVNFNDNHATVFLGQLKNPSTTASIKLKFLEWQGLEFGYPSIEYTGNNTTDELIMLVNHSSDTVFPGMSALFVENFEMSDLIRLKNGETTVTVQSGKTQRWGDYTGLQIKYNEQGVVWGSGYFGFQKSTFERVNGTYITQLKSPNYTSVNNELKSSEIKSYPNPFTDFVQIEFYADQTEVFDFFLLDISGKRIKYLQQTRVKAGKNNINLSLSPLKKGAYFLEIISTDSGRQMIELIKK